MEIAALAGVAMLGKGLLAGTINDLYSFLKSSAHHERLEEVLRESDIKAELDVLRALLEDINETDHKSTRVAAENVKEIVGLILVELKNIHNKLEYHKTRYFAGWRNPQCDENIEKLKGYRHTLCKRRKLLFSVLSVFS